jgi:hypothetical protein
VVLQVLLCFGVVLVVVDNLLVLVGAWIMAGGADAPAMVVAFVLQPLLRSADASSGVGGRFVGFV